MNNIEKGLPDDLSPAAEDAEIAGINPVFHHIVRQHGRDLFTFVASVGNHNQAVHNLAVVANKHASRAGAEAVQVAMGNFATIVSMLIVKSGWTEEQLAQVDKDTKLAHQLSLGQGSKIILPH